MSDEAADPISYANFIQTEIEAEAEMRRNRDPELVRLEQEIERAWGTVALGSAGSSQEQLLNRVEQLSLIDVHAPTGHRRGASHVKRVIRKFTRWYMRFVVDQLNAFHHVQVRLLRRTDKRLARLESDFGLGGGLSHLVDHPTEADHGLAEAVAQALSAVDGPVTVVSCGKGTIVAALHRARISAHGVDEAATTIMAGVAEGLDLRVGSPRPHLENFADGSLSAVVLTRGVERCGIAELLALIDESLRCVGQSGMVVVAVADPSTRTGPEAELLHGRGLSPATWAHILRTRGCITEAIQVAGSRVETLIVAQGL